METSPKGKLSRIVAVLVQLVIALAGLIGITFAPPAQGRILLVPLTTTARAILPAVALGHDALLLGSGPLPGSLVVMEDRKNVLWTMLRLGVLPVAASPTGCGAFTDGSARA